MPDAPRQDPLGLHLEYKRLPTPKAEAEQNSSAILLQARQETAGYHESM